MDSDSSIDEEGWIVDYSSSLRGAPLLMELDNSQQAKCIER